MLKVVDIRDVTALQLCCGCGACAYAAPDAIRMTDVLDHGRRPIVREGADTSAALAVCPGVGLNHEFDPKAAGLIKDLAAGWGPVLEVWEGYATDHEIRYAGSSGGASSALSLYCIERGGMHGLLHIAAREDVPYLNRTVMSRTRAEILAHTGSRYAPASPCDSLDLIEDAPAPSVFIGKPCDVAAVQKARKLNPQLDRNVGLTIGIFSAGTPSTRGTLAMIEQMGVNDPAAVTSVRYRGNGWPGMATVTAATANGPRTAQLTYAESWGNILQKHRQWRCYICADHTGEFADIAVGDPWYREIAKDEPGQSLIVVRTERGRQILRAALATGYVTAEQVSPDLLPRSQPNLLRLRGQVWGRVVALWLLGAGVPRYRRMPMLRFWFSQLTLKQKAQSLVGTARRVFRKGLRKRAKMVPYEPPPRGAAAAKIDSAPDPGSHVRQRAAV
jgi:coenzyme F420 hydrogenase subunit beta